jgi:hypothetical protein
MQREIFTTTTQRILVAGCRGPLTVESWNEPGVAVEAPAFDRHVAEEDGALALRGLVGELRLRVPTTADIAVEKHDGDVTITATGITVRLREIYGRSNVTGAATLLVERDPDRRERERRPEQVRRTVEAREIGTAQIAAAPDDLLIDKARRATVNAVGGNATMREIAEDLEIYAIGGSCEIRQVGGDLTLGEVGGSCSVESVAGVVRVRTVGGSAAFRATGPIAGLSSVGGSLELHQALLEPASETSMTVGGSARVELPDQPNLTINAVAGGSISGRGGLSGHGVRTIVYGDGSARLTLVAGGSVTLV